MTPSSINFLDAGSPGFKYNLPSECKTVISGLTTAGLFLASLLLSSAAAVAQEEGAALDINVNTNNGGAFYTQIWFWVVLGLVFILLLVALLKGGGSNRA